MIYDNLCYNGERIYLEVSHVINELNNWQHVFKLDPAKEINDDELEQICESGTDAIIIGGTDQVTLEGVLDLLYRVRRYVLPFVLEVSTIDAITPGFDAYFIPSVLNSKDKKWIIDMQHEAIKQYGNLINWNEIFVEGYCILNESSKAFKKTNCTLPSEKDVISYAMMAEHFLKFPIFYLEYSGTYGEPSLVAKVKQQLQHTKLFYGGGIETVKQAKEMKQFADVIVVGNVIYTDLNAALQ